MADRADISCDDVTRSADGLIGHGTEMQTDWSAQQRTILGLDASIGNDRLGAAFRVGYDQQVPATEQAATALPTAFTDLGHAAKQGVATYQQSDATSARCFPN